VQAKKQAIRVPTPLPPEHTRWKKGQSGNPSGYSRRRRLSDAVARAIEAQGLDSPIAQTLLAMALGDKDKLEGRTPEFQWFKLLVEMVDGETGTPDEQRPRPHSIEDEPGDDTGQSSAVGSAEDPDPAP
jgi:hypothetical protein